MNTIKLNLLVGFGLAVGLCTLNPAMVAAQRPSLLTIFSRLDALENDVADLQGQVTTLEGQVATLQTDNAALQAKLAYVSVEPGVLEGLAGPHVIFEGCNVHVRNGSVGTSTLNGLGNLIVGYNEDATSDDTRSGSHNLVVGKEHTYTKDSGIVAGDDNSITGALACAVGGQGNTASGGSSLVAGGYGNTASANFSLVTGLGNTATSGIAPMATGSGNTASGNYSFVAGSGNTASGNSSLAAGNGNTASGSNSFALEYLSVEPGVLEGLAGPHVIFEGCNVHVRNGSGGTSTLNGRGNLIVGYNEDATLDDRAPARTTWSLARSIRIRKTVELSSA